MNTTFLSKKGFKDLKREIASLENEEKSLQGELREIGRAKSRDDHLRRSEIIMNLENTQARLYEKRDALKTARPLPRKRDRLRVALGSVVDLVDQQGRLFRYTLVDSLEANPIDGRISIESPLGQSLVGRERTHTISWTAGLNQRELQLVDIR